MRAIDRCAILVLIALLTWILLKGFSPSEVRVHAALRGLDDYQASESALHRDVLSARAGILNNYDPLGVHIRRMDEAARAVAAQLRTVEEQRHGEALVRAMRRQEALSERFKTGNALVQNSLAYFALFSGRVSGANGTGVGSDVDRLSTAMLRLSLNGGETAGREVGMRIAALQARCRTAPCGNDVRSLLAHGALLQRVLPETATLIQELVRTGGGETARRLERHFAITQQAAEAQAGRYRFLLYLGSVLLAYLLVRVVVQVRAHAAALRRQIALEHAVASISTRLIAATPQRVKPVVNAALGELSEVLDASCACFLFAAESRTCVWPPNAGHLPPCWGEALAELATPASDGSYGIVQLSRRTLRKDSHERRALETAGIESCYCVLQPDRSAARNVLAFGFPRKHKHWAAQQLAVLSAALDAISMALEHAALEQERGRLEAQIGQARRMETVGAFASGIAHNFNNLLGAISGHAEMAAGTVENAPLQAHVEQIRVSAERGRQLVQGLLTFGRRYEHHRHPTDLGALLAESRDLVQAALGAEHSVSLSPALPATTVLADSAQLQQVILNLCNNAAQAMPAGGTVRIDLQHRRLAEASPTGDRILPPGEFALVTVTDTGCGIAPSLLRKVYEPFFTTKASGTGLGLSTAREIVAEQGGMLLLDSVPGQGTSATVWLPLMASDRDGAPAPDHLRGAGEVVLYLAGNNRAQVRGEEVLAALGYEPIGFDTGTAALAALQKAPGRFDAVLVGGMALDADATALLAHARSIAPSIPRLFAIMHADEYRGDLLADAGVTAVLQFPLDPREVALTLQRSLSAGVRQAA